MANKKQYYIIDNAKKEKRVINLNGLTLHTWVCANFAAWGFYGVKIISHDHYQIFNKFEHDADGRFFLAYEIVKE